MDKNKIDKEYQIWITAFITLILIGGSWFYTYYTLNELPNDKRGTFGDMFGSVNALYSGLAFAGIIFTILLQRKELRYQRQELTETRKEFTIQNKTLRLQRFENTFFNLLSLHHQIVDSIDLDIEKEKKGNRSLSMPQNKRSLIYSSEYERIIIKGRDVFKETYENLKISLENSDHDVNIEYLDFYKSVQTDFGHYFRNLYRLIKLVHETEFHSKAELEITENREKHEDLLKYDHNNFSERYRYTSIIRAQLSDYELLWLFYNCISNNGSEKFKPLIERYSIFKNLPKDKVHESYLINWYADSAFERL